MRNKINWTQKLNMISQDFHSLQQYREDGRKKMQLRNLTATVGFDSNFDGSASVKMGLTEVICYVIGPQDVRPPLPNPTHTKEKT